MNPEGLNEAYITAARRVTDVETAVAALKRAGLDKLALSDIVRVEVVS